MTRRSLLSAFAVVVGLLTITAPPAQAAPRLAIDKVATILGEDKDQVAVSGKYSCDQGDVRIEVTLVNPYPSATVVGSTPPLSCDGTVTPFILVGSVKRTV